MRMTKSGVRDCLKNFEMMKTILIFLYIFMTDAFSHSNVTSARHTNMSPVNDALVLAVCHFRHEKKIY